MFKKIHCWIMTKNFEALKDNLNKTISLIFVIVLAIGNLTFGNLQTKAIAQDFDPNQVLSSTDLFTLPESLNSAQKIQTFLEQQKSPLAKYSFESTLDTVKGKKYTAAEFIWAISRTGLSNRCGVRFKELCINFEKTPINPAFVLALIQREQGLIFGQFNNQDPYSENLKWRIDRTIGYACMEDPAYRCTDDNPWWQQYRGFDRQLDAGIWILLFSARSCELGEPYSNRGGSFPSNYQVNVPMTIDSQNLTPINGISCALYVYTPHIGGQKNLWSFFQKFDFGFKPGAYSLSIDQKIAEGQSFVLTVNSSAGAFSPSGNALIFTRVKELGVDSADYTKVISAYNFVSSNQISFVIARDSRDKDFYLQSGLYDVTINDFKTGKEFTLKRGFRLIDYVSQLYSPKVVDILGDKTATFESNLIDQGTKAYLAKGKSLDQLQELTTLDLKFNSIKVKFPDNMKPDMYQVLVITKDNSSLLFDKVKLSSGDEAKISARSRLLCEGGQELRPSTLVTIGGQNIQKCLKDKGFYSKAITGAINSDTIDAQKREIKATLEGKVDEKTGKLK